MYEIVSNQLCLRNGVTRHPFGSCSGLTKTTENLAIFGFVVLIYTGNDGFRDTKDDGEPNFLFDCNLCIMSGQVLPGDEGGDDPKDERQNLVIFISVGLVLTRERKELAIQ